MASEIKYTKKRIPKVVKDHSWNKWIGDNIACSKCLCCNINEIKMNNFHCGHIVAEVNGGTNSIENLKPICSACNLSMGSENLEDFKKRCEFIPISNNIHLINSIDSKKIVKKKTKTKVSSKDKYQTKIRLLLENGLIRSSPPKDFMLERCSKLCEYCSNYYHNPFNNAMCPCQKCDLCNEKGKVMFSPYHDNMCHH